MTIKEKIFIIIISIFGVLITIGGGFALSSALYLSSLNDDFSSETLSYRRAKNLFDDNTENFTNANADITGEIALPYNNKTIKIDFNLTDSELINNGGVTSLRGTLDGDVKLNGTVIDVLYHFDEPCAIDIGKDYVHAYKYLSSIDKYCSYDELNKFIDEVIDDDILDKFYNVRDSLHHGFDYQGLYVGTSAYRYLLNQLLKEDDPFSMIIDNYIIDNTLSYQKTITKSSVENVKDETSDTSNSTEQNSSIDTLLDTLDSDNFVIDNLTLHQLLKAGESSINNLGLSVEDAIDLAQEVLEMPNFYQTYQNTKLKDLKKTEDYQNLITKIKEFSNSDDNDDDEIIDKIDDAVDDLDEFTLNINLDGNFEEDHLTNTKLSLGLEMNAITANITINLNEYGKHEESPITDAQLVTLPSGEYTKSKESTTTKYIYNFDMGSADKIDYAGDGELNDKLITFNQKKLAITKQELEDISIIDESTITIDKELLNQLLISKGVSNYYFLTFDLNYYCEDSLIATSHVLFNLNKVYLA